MPSHKQAKKQKMKAMQIRTELARIVESRQSKGDPRAQNIDLAKVRSGDFAECYAAAGLFRHKGGSPSGSPRSSVKNSKKFQNHQKMCSEMARKCATTSSRRRRAM